MACGEPRRGSHSEAGLSVLDLPLMRPFNIDLGFRLSGPRQSAASSRIPDAAVMRATDRPLLQAMAEGLPLTPRPFAQLGARLGQAEDAVIERLRALQAAGILTRIGVIVRHRAIGWRSNAMVVWDLSQTTESNTAGRALARVPGVTLCYQRRTVPGLWPFGLFSMIHARSRPEALDVFSVLRLPFRNLRSAGIASCSPRAASSRRAHWCTARRCRMSRTPCPPRRWTQPTGPFINALQEGFPLTPRPFAAAGAVAGAERGNADRPHRHLREIGAITRFGPFFDAEAMGGAFCLCAMAVPADRFEAVVTLVNAHPEVAHNYERSHRLNMWFVLACEKPGRH